MDLRHPVQSLNWALIRALERDLEGVESPVANDLLTTQASETIKVRPVEKDCSVVMFTQTWSVGALGLTRQQSDRSSIDAETVVITGPCGDACVYVSTQLLYHVVSPNRRFFLDLAAQHMRAKAEASVYEGRDSSDEEAFDYEVAGALARVCGAVRHMGRCDADRVIRKLRDCVAEFEQASRTCPGRGDGHVLARNEGDC
jgi:hypothetical protein